MKSVYFNFIGNLDTVKSYNEQLENSNDKDISEVAKDLVSDKAEIKE